MIDFRLQFCQHSLDRRLDLRYIANNRIPDNVGGVRWPRWRPLDLEYEDMVRPALLDDLSCVPEALCGGIEFLQQGDVVVPRDSCKKLLHDCPHRPGRGEGAHVLEIAR